MSERLLLLLACAGMSMVALWYKAPLWLAIPFGPLYVLVFVALGYFLNGGPPNRFWGSLWGDK